MKVLLLGVSLLCSAYVASATQVVCNPDDINLPNPDDCSSFYICDNGVPRLTLCPPTLHFNPDINVCDRPENVNCQTSGDTSSTEEPTTPTTSKPTSTTSTTNRPTSTSSPNTSTSTASSPTSTSSTTTPQTPTTSKPTSTTSTTNRPTSTSAPTSTSSPNTSTSTTSKPTSTSSTTTPQTSTTSTTTSTTSSPNSSTSPTSRPTSTSSTTSSPTSTTSRPSSSSTTTEEPTTIEPSTGCPAEGSAIIANPDSCNAFLVCINGNSVSVDCPRDLQFNPEIGACDLDENVLCGDEITTTEEPTTTDEATTVQEPTSTVEPTTEEDKTTATSPSSTSSSTSKPTTTTTTTTRRPTTITTRRPTTTTTRRPTTTTTLRPTTSSSTTTRPTTSSPTTPSSTTTEETTSSETPDTTEQEPSTVEDTTTTDPPTELTTTVRPNDCPENGTAIIPNPETCNSFLVCINGISVSVSCPGNMQFNPKINECDLDENVQCEGEETTDTTTEQVTTEELTTEGSDETTTSGSEETTTDSNEETTTDSNEETTTEGEQTTTEGNEVTTTGQPNNKPDCPETGYAILSNPEDCGSFFVCINGLSAKIDCPAGLDFNVTTAKCEEPAIAQCRGEPTTDTPSTTPDPYVPPCPSQGITQLSDPRECSSFYVCIDGLFAKLDCPEDLQFNEVRQSCVAASQANCTSSISELFSEDLEFQCSEDGSYPNPDDCGSYFVCVGGTAIHMDCPAGLHFDSSLLSCNTPELANCDASGSTSTTSKPSSTSSTSTTTKPTSTTSTTTPNSSSTSTTSKPTTVTPTTSTSTTTTTSKPSSTSEKPGVEPNCPANGTVILPNPIDCASFYVCIEGDYGLVECPPGYGFNEELSNCDSDVQCGDEGTSAPPEGNPDCPSSGIAKVPNPADCGSYLFCINGQSAIINCPSGLNFNTDTSSCDADAKCEISSSTSSPTSATSTSSTSKPTSPTTSKPTTPPSTSCQQTGDILPNPASCESFFICDNGVPVEVQCPPGLEFNAQLLVCDNPSNANCKISTSIGSFLRFWY